MSPEVISHALALSFQTIAQSSSSLELQVGVAGYPLENLLALNQIIDVVANTDNVRFQLLICDGTRDVRPFALKHGMQVCFEIGGTPLIQDKLWPMSNEDSSASVVEQNIRAWIEASGVNHAIAHAQITGANTEVSDYYRYLYQLGFRRIRLQPLRFGPAPYAIDEQNVNEVTMAYDRFIDLLIGMNDDMLLSYLNALWGTDMLGQFVGRLLTHTGTVSSCPAGKALLSVDVDGKVYACPRFSGLDEYRLGTVEEGLSRETYWPYLECLLVDRRTNCAGCWARYLCGGGCCYSGVRKSCALNIPDPVHCTLLRHVASLAIWLVATIEATRPQVLQSLQCRELYPSKQTGLKCPLSSVLINDKQQLIKQGLILYLANAEQMCGHIWQGIEEISCTCHIMADAQHLHIHLEIGGSSFRPEGTTEKGDFIAIRFANQPNTGRFIEYHIKGDHARLVTRDADSSKDVILRSLNRALDGGRSYWLCLPWTNLNFRPQAKKVFGINIRIGIRSLGEEVNINCFPTAKIGVITLDT